jgi:hypothetical protein
MNNSETPPTFGIHDILRKQTKHRPKEKGQTIHKTKEKGQTIH